MPRKKQASDRIKTETERRKSATWGGFIRCELDTDMRENFLRYAEKQGENVLAMLDLLVKEGYVYSVRLDEENAAYVSRLQITLGEKPATWILTAFHGTVLDSLLLLCFKHFIVLDSDWSLALEEDIGKPGWG